MTVSSTSKLLGPIAVTLILTGPLAAEAAAAHPAHHTAPHSASGAARLASQGPPAAAEPDGVVRHSGANGAEREGVLDYWTAERMESALPAGSLLDEVFPTPETKEGGTEDGRTRPSASRTASGQHSTGERWTSGGAVTRTTGRVFLTMGGRDLTCSAAVVPAENRDTVVTAGHCLKDGTGAWAGNWTFVPGYDNGEAPYGRYVVREALVDRKWSAEAEDSFDFGMAVLHPTGDNHVQDQVGAQRIAFGDRSGQQTYAFGYPTAGGFDGSGLHYCAGRPTADKRGTTASGMRCAMTEGSSGGPWLTDFDPASGEGTITSVISFKYANDASTQFGPRLGDEAERLYEEAGSL
ncbi:V8-like Glu-specific endopeptidase [Lipingzhangella halophila]|uniref:V8-like Glu-specific endopeptidase n=1 Tax=Lipingzhangella halophila TaxID=1783352 RepID=A0A7W7RKH4_9ACTN|nr:trypsin-like peptidase domain-containing protein [Lipingzhangella halophila]MBB4933487.1 V8-like Glu-specific endopeptidase [Lipingzhangella halophila]